MSELLARRALECDVVFLIEGEEEAGSMGFSDAVQRQKDLIGPVDVIFVSNSTWINDERPCITYGLRGVVHCSVEVRPLILRIDLRLLIIESFRFPVSCLTCIPVWTAVLLQSRCKIWSGYLRHCPTADKSRYQASVSPRPFHRNCDAYNK